MEDRTLIRLAKAQRKLPEQPKPIEPAKKAMPKERKGCQMQGLLLKLERGLGNLQPIVQEHVEMLSKLGTEAEKQKQEVQAIKVQVVTDADKNRTRYEELNKQISELKADLAEKIVSEQPQDKTALNIIAQTTKTIDSLVQMIPEYNQDVKSLIKDRKINKEMIRLADYQAW